MKQWKKYFRSITKNNDNCRCINNLKYSKLLYMIMTIYENIIVSFL